MKADADPNLIVYFGGEYMPLREARVGILTHALHYGTGVFEGIRAYWDEDGEELFVLRPREHYERWKQNCGILRIDVPLEAEEFCAITIGADAAQRLPQQCVCAAAGLQERGADRRERPTTRTLLRWLRCRLANICTPRRGCMPA